MPMDVSSFVHGDSLTPSSSEGTSLIISTTSYAVSPAEVIIPSEEDCGSTSHATTSDWNDIMCDLSFANTRGDATKSMCTGEFIHFFVMCESLQVVNCMRELRLGISIDLEQLHHLLPHGKFYRGRPKMLVVRMSCGHNLQLFPNGCIQIMGRVSHSNALSMSSEILQHLRQLYPHLRMPTLTLKNLVVSVRLKKKIPLHHIKHSSSTHSYEPELFPALLVRRYHPVHIAVFHTGRCILTGLQSMEQAHTIVSQLSEELNNNHLF